MLHIFGSKSNQQRIVENKSFCQAFCHIQVHVGVSVYDKVYLGRH